jgi:hypothetical protein
MARRNHLVWIGVLLAVFGLVSYFTLAVRVAALRDVPVLNLALVAAGAALSAVAIGRRRSWWALAGLALSAACAAMLFGYVFVLSEQLPTTEQVVPVGAAAPAFELPDGAGGTVALGDYAGRRVVLVFYRGFW